MQHRALAGGRSASACWCLLLTEVDLQVLHQLLACLLLANVLLGSVLLFCLSLLLAWTLRYACLAQLLRLQLVLVLVQLWLRPGIAGWAAHIRLWRQNRRRVELHRAATVVIRL